MHPFVNTAISAARAAGQIICRGYDDPTKLQVAVKTSQFDLVSNIDKQAESEIRYHINKAYPKHAILGEEEGGDLDEIITRVRQKTLETKAMIHDQILKHIESSSSSTSSTPSFGPSSSGNDNDTNDKAAF